MTRTAAYYVSSMPAACIKNIKPCSEAGQMEAIHMVPSIFRSGTTKCHYLTKRLTACGETLVPRRHQVVGSPRIFPIEFFTNASPRSQQRVSIEGRAIRARVCYLKRAPVSPLFPTKGGQQVKQVKPRRCIRR